MDTEDYQIALDMGLPYFLRQEERTGVYLNGPMLQSAEWFNLYLKPRGFCYIEQFVERDDVLQTLRRGSMLGIQVTPTSKHAVVFLGMQEDKYKFLNNKWETSEEPEGLLLSAEECLERLPEQVTVGCLKPCAEGKAELKPYYEEALVNWEKLRTELHMFISVLQSPLALKEAMNRLFRPLLLDGISMAKLLDKKELTDCLEKLQKEFLAGVRKNEAVCLAEEFSRGELDKAVDAFVEMITLQL